MSPMTGTVIVVGSINVDLTIVAPTIPRPGQTVLGSEAVQAWGGKGANQAVAAASAGADVWMIGAVGDDSFGAGATAALQASTVRTDHVAVVNSPTGLASIIVDANGENAITVAPGANQLATVPEADAFAGLEKNVVVLVSLEVADNAVVAAADLAVGAGWTLVVNPAPARELPSEVLDASPVLVPNLHEALALTGTTDAADAGRQLHQRTGAPVVVTLGAEGALLVGDVGCTTFDAPTVDTVDSTGAGDALCGALAAALAAGHSMPEAVVRGIGAGSRAVTHAGARPTGTQQR